MPTYDTPYGRVDAPNTEAMQKWLATKKGGTQGAGPSPAQPPTQPAGGALDALWAGLKGLNRGGQDILEGGAKIGARMGAEEGGGAFADPQQLAGRRQAVDAYSQQSQQAYQQDPAVVGHPWAAGLGRLAGNVGAGMAASPPIPGGGVAMGLGGRALLGAGQGAMQAAAQSGGNIGQTLLGAGAGGFTGGAGGVIGPRIPPALQKIGQQFPSMMRMVQGIEGRTVEGFQRAFANHVLDPLGIPLKRGVKAGDELVNDVEDKLDAAYEAVKPHLQFDPGDPKFRSGLQALNQDAAKELSPAKATQFGNIIQTHVAKPLQKGGGYLDGAAFKRAERVIGGLARKALGPKGTFDDELLGGKLRDLQQLMRDTLVDQNGGYATHLQKINKAWRRFVTMDLAAERNVDARRTFTPHDIRMVLGEGGAAGRRMMDPEGVAMRAFSEAGDDMMAGKGPDLTKLQKFAVDIAGMGAGFAVGKELGHPYWGAIAGRGLAEAAVPAVKRGLAVTGTPGARRVGAAVSRAAPAAAAAAARPSPIGP